MTNKDQRIKKLEQVFEFYANEEHEKAHEYLKSIILEVSADIIKNLEDEEEMIEMMDRDEGHDLASDIAKNKKRIRAEEMYDDYDYEDDYGLEEDHDYEDDDDYEEEDEDHDYEDDDDYEEDDDFDYDNDSKYNNHETHHQNLNTRVGELEDDFDDFEDDFESLKAEFDELQSMEQEEDHEDMDDEDMDDEDMDDEDMDDEEMEEGRDMMKSMGKGYGKHYNRKAGYYDTDSESNLVSEAERLNKVDVKHKKHQGTKSPYNMAGSIEGLEAYAPNYDEQTEETPSFHKHKTYKGTNTAKKGSDYLKKSDRGGYKK